MSQPTSKEYNENTNPKRLLNDSNAMQKMIRKSVKVPEPRKWKNKGKRTTAIVNMAREMHDKKRKTVEKPISEPGEVYRMESPNVPKPRYKSVMDWEIPQPSAPIPVVSLKKKPPPPIVLQQKPPAIENSKPAPPKVQTSPKAKDISVCFSTEDCVTGLDTTPNGRYVVAAFSCGSVRLFDLHSSMHVDRYGYLLGHLDEDHNQQMSASIVRVIITPDGKFCFVGCRAGLRVVMSIKLSEFCNKDSQTTELKKYFHSDAKLRGFAHVIQDQHDDKSYMVLCGLGIGKLRIWRFTETSSSTATWTLVHEVNSNGNTVYTASFLPHVDSSSCVFVSRSDDKDVRRCSMMKDLATGQYSPSWTSLKDTQTMSIISGSYGYGTTSVGGLWRVDLNTDERKRFELLPSSPKSSKRMVSELIDSVSSTTDGSHAICLSSKGSLYYFDCTASSEATYYGRELKKIDLSMQHSIYRARLHICVEKRSKRPLILFSPNPDSTSGYVCIESLGGFTLSDKADKDKLCWICQEFYHSHWSSQEKKEVEERARKQKCIEFLSEEEEEEEEEEQEEEKQDQLIKTRKRLQEVQDEANRRLKAELQLRRAWNQKSATWKTKESSFEDEIRQLKSQVKEYRELEEKYTKLRLQASAKASPEAIQIERAYTNMLSGGCASMSLSKLEELNTSLVAALQCNLSLIKGKTSDPGNECIICRETKASVAVYPCGHVCFCPKDSKLYKPIPGQKRKECPVCQAEILSLLSLYYP